MKSFEDYEPYHIQWILDQVKEKESMQFKAIKLFVNMKKSKSEYKSQLLKELEFNEKGMQENIGYIIHEIDYWGLY